jgi:hypothetical protein
MKAIYERLVDEGEQHVAVLGDFNDTPDSAPLAPLLQRTDLKDISTHPAFTSDGRPGTFGNGTKSQKIDYVLLSPVLYGNVIGGAVFRTGVWGGKNGTLFHHYDTMMCACARPPGRPRISPRRRAGSGRLPSWLPLTHQEQATFRHCNGLPLPFARLPPPSMTPGTASMPRS